MATKYERAHRAAESLAEAAKSTGFDVANQYAAATGALRFMLGEALSRLPENELADLIAFIDEAVARYRREAQANMEAAQ